MFHFKDIEFKLRIRSKLRCSFYADEPFYISSLFFINRKEKNCSKGRKGGKKKWSEIFSGNIPDSINSDPLNLIKNSTFNKIYAIKILLSQWEYISLA